MDALLSALATKFAGSDLSNYVGGRIFEGEAPQGTERPYVAYDFYSTPDDTFTEQLDEVHFTFHLFSDSKSSVEASTMYGYLKALLDGANLTITGYTCLWCRREGMSQGWDDIPTKSGTARVRHWTADYSIKVQES
ncbi:MAG: DUF3168 domain-containing protein [Methanoregulaceae archaeon]|nr:DUF3168 domain-containing protein [Methanoregulaceae archaeon]